MKPKNAGFRQRMAAKIKYRKRRIARLLEYRRIRRIRRKTTPAYTYCKNCGEKLQGMYCHRCGQYALDVEQPFWKYLKQYFENVYQFDSKVWQTLWLLFRRPGFLTTEFNQGKISSYVHPFRLYMFLSVLFFLVISVIMPDYINLPSDATGSSPEHFRRDLFVGHLTNWFSSWLPIIMMVFIPFYALMLRRFFRKENMPFMGHFVFGLHVHSIWLVIAFFHTLLLYFGRIGGATGNFRLLYGIVIGLVFLYQCLSIHRVYRHNGWLKTIVKSLAILCIYYTLVFLVLIAIVVWRSIAAAQAAGYM